MSRTLPNGLAVVDEDMPDFLRMTPEERNEAWQRKPPTLAKTFFTSHRSEEQEEEFQRVQKTKEIEAREKREATFAKLKEKALIKKAAEPPRIKPEPFSNGVTISVIKPSPRNAGTKGADRYAAMVVFLKLKPAATLTEILGQTSYRLSDYHWDLKRGHITSDLRRQSSTEADRNRQK